MDLELFGKYMAKAAPLIRARVDLAKILQEEESMSDQQALKFANDIADAGLRAMISSVEHLGSGSN